MADQAFDPLPANIASDPKFQALSPEAQAVVRQKWATKFASLSPAAQDVVRAKRVNPAESPNRPTYVPKPTAPPAMLDERGQPLPAAGALPPGAVEDVEQTIPTHRGMESLSAPWKPGMEAAKKIQSPVLRGAAEFAAENFTPMNALLGGGIATLPETAATAATGAFSAMALKAMAQQAPEAYRLWKAGDKGGALRELTKLGLTGLVAVVTGKHAVKGAAGAMKGPPQVHGPTAETFWKAQETIPLSIEPEDLQTTELSKPPPRPPPAAAAPPAPPVDLSEVGNQPTRGAMAPGPPPEDLSALQGLTLEGDEGPLPYEAPPEGRRGPRAPLEPAENIPQAEYPGPTGELRQEAIPEELIGQPEPALTDQAEVYQPGEPEPHTGQAAPAQHEFLPHDLTGEPEPGIEVELARQEATLEGQEKAAAVLKKELPDSEAAKAIESQAEETKQKVKRLRQVVEQQKASREPPTIKNPPAAPANEARLRAELSMRNVNPDDPQAVLDHIREVLGLQKAAQVTTVGTYPVSKSIETPERYEADLAEAKPSSVLHEATHMAEAEGGPKPPEGPGANDRITGAYLKQNDMSDRALGLNRALQAAADRAEVSRQQFDIATGAAERIGAGAMGRETRTEFREAGPPTPDTKHVAVSEAEVLDMKGRVSEALVLARDAINQGDPTSRLAGKALHAQAVRLLQEFKVASKAASGALRAFQMPTEMIRHMRELGLTAAELREMKLREPLLNEIAQVARAWHKGEIPPGEAWKIIGRDMVDGFRYNLFSPFSFMLHIGFSDVPFQIAAAGGRDVANVLRGDFSAPNLHGWLTSLTDRASKMIGRTPLELDPRIQQAIGDKTASGELVRGGFTGQRGTFLRREGPVSTAVDYTFGSPLYAKVALDRAAGNLAAEATLYAEAYKATPKGLSGEAARAFREDFVNHAPDDVIARAVENAQKAKFNRPLSKFEERVAGSTTYRLLVDVFARWPFQATRAMAEWFGMDPKVFAKIKAGTLNSEELGGYLAKTATGLGGLTLLNSLVYPNVDFNSMQYVHRDEKGMETGRTRLVEPVPAAFVLLGMMRAAGNLATGNKDEAQRDIMAAKSSLQYASLPFARLASYATGGELSGVLSSAFSWLRHGGQDRTAPLDPNGLRRAFVDQVNRLIPGQAVLAALKQIIDPVEREGIGARLPGISLALEQRPNRTEGGPMIRKSALPFGAGEASLSANMPGSTHPEDVVEALLMRYGQPVYRGPRSPVAGVPPAEIPDDLKHEWEENLGLARQLILRPLANRLHLSGNDLEAMGPERARAVVQRLDARAAAIATKWTNAHHEPQPKPFRRETLQELVGPEQNFRDYINARMAKRKAQEEAMK